MSVLAAIAGFPVLTLVLIGLSKAEDVLYAAAPAVAEQLPADPPSRSE